MPFSENHTWMLCFAAILHQKETQYSSFQHPISLKKYQTNINQYPKKDQEHPITERDQIQILEKRISKS